MEKLDDGPVIFNHPRMMKRWWPRLVTRPRNNGKMT